jgi:hypothetical protein
MLAVVVVVLFLELAEPVDLEEVVQEEEVVQLVELERQIQAAVVVVLDILDQM